MDLNIRRVNMSYLENLTEMLKKQQEKGVKHYGDVLDNDKGYGAYACIENAQEELVDALFYLEHLRNQDTVKTILELIEVKQELKDTKIELARVSDMMVANKLNHNDYSAYYDTGLNKITITGLDNNISIKCHMNKEKVVNIVMPLLQDVEELFKSQYRELIDMFKEYHLDIDGYFLDNIANHFRFIKVANKELIVWEKGDITK